VGRLFYLIVGQPLAGDTDLRYATASSVAQVIGGSRGDGGRLRT